MKNKQRLIAVVGPTASGKTALAIQLAQKYNGEVVSADSMQIYRGMDIATAKPTVEEMCGIRHHLIDFLSPNEKFSVSQYVDLARSVISDIHSRRKMPILCGGTGLYVRSLLENVQFSPNEADEELRKQLRERYDNEGGQALIDEISTFDPETAKLLHPSNVKRIIRAIEVYRVTGVTMSEYIRKSKLIPSPYNLTEIGITYHDRQKLYDRINLRVDIMVQNGLIDEAKAFYQRENSQTANAAIGYKELKPYLDGEISLDDAVEKLKLETRHYAKRQLTWFRRDEYIQWIQADLCKDVFAEAVKMIEADNTKEIEES